MPELRSRRTVCGSGGSSAPSGKKYLSDTDTDAAEETHATSPQLAGSSALQAHTSGENKLKKLLKRLLFGNILIGVLCSIIALGQLATMCFVVLVQVLMFRELVNVRYRNREFTEVPLFRTTQWGWFFSALLYSYGKFFSQQHMYVLVSSSLMQMLLRYVEITALGLYSAMLMTVVLTLKKGYYKYQMGQLAWTIAIIVITVVQVDSFTQNIFNGLFWFLYPVSLVICNDSMAYFAGLALGRKITSRVFSAISPNKTWEGFVGGGICTVIFAAFAPLVFLYFPSLMCPCKALFSSIFAQQCELPQVFRPVEYWLPSLLSYAFGAETVTLLPIQGHGLVLGAFASIVAPFGGLFASGIKRAYNLKDFSTLIPGHGGVFDRVDCQLIMGLATHIYFSTFIAGVHALSPARLIQLVGLLTAEDQLEIYRTLGKSLKQQKML